MWILVFAKTCFEFFDSFVLLLKFLLQLVDSLFHLEKPREKFVFAEVIPIHYDHLSVTSAGSPGWSPSGDHPWRCSISPC
jgi:hypothetical protein